MDADKRNRNLGILALLLMGSACCLFLAAAAGGAMAMTYSVLGFVAMIGGLAASAPLPRPGDPEEWPDPSPPAPREPPAPQQAIHLTLKADTPPAGVYPGAGRGSWLERVERMAEAEAGKGRG